MMCGAGVELKRDAKARQMFGVPVERSAFSILADRTAGSASFFLPPLFLYSSVYTITVVASPSIGGSAQTPTLFPPTGRLYAVLNNRRRPHNRECCPLLCIVPVLFHLWTGCVRSHSLRTLIPSRKQYIYIYRQSTARVRTPATMVSFLTTISGVPTHFAKLLSTRTVSVSHTPFATGHGPPDAHPVA